jgi:hypothetical protein
MPAVVAFHRFAAWGDDFRAANAEPSTICVAPVAIDCIGIGGDGKADETD